MDDVVRNSTKLKMYNELKYRNITYFGALFLIIGLFIEFADPMNSGIFSLIYAVVAIITFTFAFLWLKRTILLIGLIFYTFDFNIDLLFNPLLSTSEIKLINENLEWMGIIFNLLGFICLVLGLSSKSRNEFLNKTTEIGIRTTLATIILTTGIVQTLIRIF